MEITLTNISEHFRLNKQETELVNKSVYSYCTGNRIVSIANGIFNGVKSITGQSDWQKAHKILESKLSGKNRNITADLLLKICLSREVFYGAKYAYFFPPIGFDDWSMHDLGQASIEHILEWSQCSIENSTIK